MDQWKKLAELANPDGWLWETDSEHRFVWMSESVERITGVPAAWHYGKSRVELRSEEVDESWRAHLDVLERHLPFDGFEFDRAGPDGVRRLSTSGIPFFDERNNFLGYRGIARDLTREYALNERAAALAGVIDEVDDAVAVWGPDDRLIYCNRAFRRNNRPLERILESDIDYADYLRQGIEAGLFPEAREAPEEWHAWRMRRHRSPSKPFDVRRQDGRVLQVKEQRLENGCIILVGTDVTEQRRLVDEVNVAMQRFADFAEASSDWFWEQDADLRFSYMSSTNRQFSGMDRSELIGKTRYESAPMGVTEEMWREHDRVVAAREPLSDFRIGRIAPDGTRRVLTIYGRPYYDEHGEFAGYRGIGRDITGQIEMENALRAASEQATAANAAKSEFLSSMSHELRTPLNSILGFIQLLELNPAVKALDDVSRAVSIIHRSGNHLLSLIGDVLELSRIESGQLDLSLEDVFLSDVVDECAETMRAMAERRQLSVRIDVPDDLLVRADMMRLKQVVLNLLSNAVKYNRDHGSITIAASAQPGGQVRLTVSDTGCGIRESRYDDVYQPFTRLGAEQTEVEGTGIGLTIAKRIIEAMDGQIGFRSSEGVGSDFWIELPRPQVQEDSPSPVQIARGSSANGAGPDRIASQRKILYVEDNPANVELMEMIVAGLGEVQMISAPTGEIGIQLAIEHAPEIILLDVNLPGLNGYDVIEALRRSDTVRGSPIIGISARATKRDLERARQAGFDEYVTKPIDVHGIIQILTGYLAPKG